MVLGVKAVLVARNNYTFTFTNAQPGSDVGFSARVYPDAVSAVEDGPLLVLDSSNAVSVWSDATILTAHTVDGAGNTLVATATVSSLSVTADSGTAGHSPFGGGGGGASEQSPVVRKFTFAHGDAGLNNGIAVYTPTVGEILVNAWIQVDTAFNGTTPIADVGQFVAGGSNGWFSGGGSVPVGAGKADAGSLDTTLLSGRSMSDLSLMLAFYNMLTSGQEAIDVDGTSIVADGATLILGGIRFLPAKFASTDPVKIVVSQDGTAGGAATGATAGAGTLYLVTAIPA